MKTCVVKGCESVATDELKDTLGMFSGRKQGMFMITYHICKKHEGTNADIDKKKFVLHNPHAKGAI